MFEIIKKYYKWLFCFSKNTEEDNILDSTKETEEPQKSKYKKCLCSIDFSVNVDNTMDIVCHWPDLDDLDEETINAIAAKYAVLLHAINYGIVREDVTSTLSNNLESNNPSDRYFVYEVLSKMVDLGEKRKDQYYYGPIIKPSNVFRYYNDVVQK
jgi:hypothetical protein